MQIVSIGDNLHEMSNPVFWEKKEKNHQFVVCWICPEHAKCWPLKHQAKFVADGSLEIFFIIL